MNSSRTWHKGPPPHIGWWNASSIRNLEIWRWWNGKNWSISVHCSKKAEYAALRASVSAGPGWGIEWSDYWPENASVPRIDPK